MLETYFVAPKTLRRVRAGPSGPYIDGFAGSLEQDGFSHACAIRYLRAAAHLGHFVQRQGRMLMDTDSSTAEAFFRHFEHLLILGYDFILIEFGDFLDITGILRLTEILEPFEQDVLFTRY